MAISGKVGRVLTQKRTDPITFTDEPTTANVDKTRYTITDNTKRYWDRNTVVTVKKDSIIQTTGFHLEYPGGVVVFDTPLTTETVTVSGKYVELEQLAGFFNWSLTVENKTIDTTCFESGEWDEFILGTKNWKASAEKFWASTDDFTQRLGSEVLVVFYADFGTLKARFEGYAVINTDVVDIAVNDVIKDKLDFSGSQGIYFRQG